MADRMFDVLTRLMGQLHAGRVTMHVWLQSAMRGEHPIASKFGLQIGFGAIVLAMRQLDDFWSDQVPTLYPDRQARPAEGKWLVDEVKSRNLRNTANLLVAHYAQRTKQLLSADEGIALIRSNRWDTEDEVIAWTKQVIEKVGALLERLNDDYQLGKTFTAL